MVERRRTEAGQAEAGQADATILGDHGPFGEDGAG
jgi:hypothetical protein